VADENTNGQTTTIGAGNVEGLLAFLDYLVDKGYATQSAVHPLKAATRTTFSKMEGEKFREFDVRTFDADEYMDRFQNRVIGQYKQESLASYRQRVKKAIAAYRDYLANGNVSAIGSRAPRQRRLETPSSATSAKKSGEGDVHAPDVTGSLIDYPFPLRSGQVAHLRLPMKLEKADADRLSTFLRSLVFDPQLELSAAVDQAA
jgi:hypothetical protein